ncbi:hypothetical protein ABFS83_09G015900 [Erythranthe nasuta]
MASSSSTYNPPCAACKFLRRKCTAGCIFSGYFPPEEPQKFANVHKIFGASNVAKLLNDLLPHQRDDAVQSLAYEAEARVRDPVYGCVGAISFLQRQVDRLQKELDAANADLIRLAAASSPSVHMPPHHRPAEFGRRFANEGGGGGGGGGGGRFYQTPGYQITYNASPWADIYNPHGGGFDGNI